MTPDTTPEAITQAGRDAVADYLGCPMIRAGSHDHHPLVQAFARHRRLTSHSAGEGLREALIRVARMIPGVLCADGVSDAFLAHIPDELAHYTITRTPPSDAGSTTRSGAEGVRDANGMVPWHGGEGPSDWERVGWCRNLRGEIVSPPDARDAPAWTWLEIANAGNAIVAFTPPSALATTPSPDASPDSGEATVRYQGCNRPPDGWWCCSKPGHDGPCPTRRIGEL